MIHGILKSENHNVLFSINMKDLYNDVNFGLGPGKPISVGVVGKVGSLFRNLFELIDAQEGQGS